MDVNDPSDLGDEDDCIRGVISESDEDIIPPTDYQYQGKRKANSPISQFRSGKISNASGGRISVESNSDNVTKINKNNYSFHGFSTSAHENNGNIILIKPQTDDINVNIKNFFKNDISLAVNLDKTIFGKIGIKNVRKNLNRDILIIELRNAVNKENLSEILNLSQIGTWKVDCRLPQNRQISCGVIGPIDQDTCLDELYQYLRKTNPDVISLKRLFKGKVREKNPSQCIKITFNNESLPDYVYVGYQ